jgi:hypothetical protein
MWRQKAICVNCRKSLKGFGTCGCKNPNIQTVSTKIRFPKTKGSKAKWKKMLKQFSGSVVDLLEVGLKGKK